MEINTQQLEALTHLQEQQAQLPRKQSGSPAGFEALLNHELATDPDAPAAFADAALARTENVYNRILLDGTEENEAPDPDSAVLMAAFDQASGALDLWDSYTRTLGTAANGASLRNAWGLLEGIDAQMAQLRDNPARGKSSALDSLLNELEIMTATEKFKFNRGDYL